MSLQQYDLKDLLTKIDEIDDELIIYQKGDLSINSETVVLEPDDNVGAERFVNGTKYVYFLEVSLAKEFIKDWLTTKNTPADWDEIAQRLVHYAIYDA